MKNIIYVFLISCFSFTIISCAKKSGGGSGNSSSDDSSTGSSNIGPQKVYIVGYAVTEKCIHYDCPKSKVVL